MLYHLLVPLSDEFGFLNVFRYLTFRSGGAMLTALILAWMMGPLVIRWLKSLQGEGQPIRSDGPQHHIETKRGTPTMGGLLILFSMTISTLLWADLSNGYVWVVMGVGIGFGLIGFMDDFLKLTKKNPKGLSGKKKLLGQIIISVAAMLAITHLTQPPLTYQLAIPFFKAALFDLGVFYIAFAVFVMVGASNAVNLTDGLDGLAIVPVIIVAGCFALIAYLVGNAVFANYLQIHFVPGTGEIAVLCAALIGSGLGFLWYNAPPAHVFMGDVGSLSLGGILGAISVITKHEFVLAITGGLFVIEAISVILQVGYYKMTKKRIFLMAPIHHHFEKKGWKESTVVIRFWIIAIVFALIGLSTLKLR